MDALPADVRGRVARAMAWQVYRPRQPETPTPRMRAEGVRLLDALLAALEDEGYVVARTADRGASAAGCTLRGVP